MFEKEAKEIIKRLMDIINHDLKCFDTIAGKVTIKYHLVTIME